jgi:hypothetical protein
MEKDDKEFKELNIVEGIGEDKRLHKVEFINKGKIVTKEELDQIAREAKQICESGADNLPREKIVMSTGYDRLGRRVADYLYNTKTPEFTVNRENRKLLTPTEQMLINRHYGVSGVKSEHIGDDCLPSAGGTENPPRNVMIKLQKLQDVSFPIGESKMGVTHIKRRSNKIDPIYFTQENSVADTLETMLKQVEHAPYMGPIVTGRQRLVLGTTHLFQNVIDHDFTALYPSTARVQDDITHHKNNSRKERRLLRRASRKYGVRITEIVYNFFSRSVLYYHYGDIVAKEPKNIYAWRRKRKGLKRVFNFNLGIIDSMSISRFSSDI